MSEERKKREDGDVDKTIKFESEGGFLRAMLFGDIDHHSAARMRETIDKKLFCEKPLSLILDFSAVQFMDSSGIGLILGRLEIAAELGASVRLEGLSGQLSRLVRLSGIEKMKGLTVSV